MEDRQSEINRFWEKAGSLGMTHETRRRVTNPRQRRDEVLLSNDIHTIEKTTLGTTEKDGDTALVTLVHRPTGYTGDRDTRILAQYFEKKSTIDDVVHRVGPSVYYYPSGEMAALEMYSETYDVHQPKGKLLDHVCFNDNYERTSLATFDVHYRNVFKNMGFPEIVEYAPRISEYKRSVNDLNECFNHIEKTLSKYPSYQDEDLLDTYFYKKSMDLWKFVDDNIKFQDGKPFIYLDMLSQDVNATDEFKKKYIYKKINQIDFVKAGLRKHHIPTHCQPDKEMIIISRQYGKLVLKNDFHEIVKGLNTDIRSELYYRGAQYYCPEVYLELHKDKKDKTITRQIVWYGNMEESCCYYPDGNVCISKKIEFNQDKFSQHADYCLRYACYDSYGKLCSYDKASKSFLAEWKDQKQCITMSIDSKGGYEKFWNMRHSGFDVNVLKMELDGKKIDLCDGMELAPGRHEVKIILDTSHDLLMSPSLFKGCSKHDDLSINDIPAERFINPPEEIKKAIKRQEKTRLNKNKGLKR